MIAVELPKGLHAREMQARFIDAGMWQRGPAGGVDLRINRGGGRYGATLYFPPVDTLVGRLVVARMIQAMRRGLRAELPLGDFHPGAPGSPVVDGDGQAGTSLAVKGFTPNYAIREGQWFNHIRGDDAKLYNVAAGTIADATGTAVLSIEPELGIEPQDGDALLFARPVIQGAPVGNEAVWRLRLERLLEFEINIEETA